MDISTFFWDYLRYEMGQYEPNSTIEHQIFKAIPQGDLIMNTRVLNASEEMEYLYYDSWYRLIQTALRICEGNSLKLIERYLELKEEDEYMMDAFQASLSDQIA